MSGCGEWELMVWLGSLPITTLAWHHNTSHQPWSCAIKVKKNTKENAYTRVSLGPVYTTCGIFAKIFLQPLHLSVILNSCFWRKKLNKILFWWSFFFFFHWRNWPNKIKSISHHMEFIYKTKHLNLFYCFFVNCHSTGYLCMQHPVLHIS